MARDPIERFDAGDAEMEAAIWEAKHSFGQFLTAFLQPKENQTAFLVKVAFVEEDQVEHLWVADLDLSSKTLQGIIANEPRLKGFRFMQPVTFEPAQITDWMYVEEGRLVGGYTTRLIRQRMSGAERAAFDAAYPYRF